MFYLFLKDYETNLFNADHRKFKEMYVWEILLLFISLALVVAMAALSFHNPFSIENLKGRLFIILLIALLFIIMNFLENKRERKETNKTIERFMQHKFQPFIAMLRDQKYALLGKSLSSEEGVEWLLKACSMEIDKSERKPSGTLSIKSLFLTLILPLMTCLGGTFMLTLSAIEKIDVLIAALVLLLMLCVIYFMAAPMLNSLLTKRIRVIEDLVMNLEYYKMLISHDENEQKRIETQNGETLAPKA